MHSPLQSSAILVRATLERVDRPAPNSLGILHDLELVQDGNLRKGKIHVDVVEQDQTGNVLHQSGCPLSPAAHGKGIFRLPAVGYSASPGPGLVALATSPRPQRCPNIGQFSENRTTEPMGSYRSKSSNPLRIKRLLGTGLKMAM